MNVNLTHFLMLKFKTFNYIQLIFVSINNSYSENKTSNSLLVD